MSACTPIVRNLVKMPDLFSYIYIWLRLLHKTSYCLHFFPSCMTQCNGKFCKSVLTITTGIIISFACIRNNLLLLSRAGSWQLNLFILSCRQTALSVQRNVLLIGLFMAAGRITRRISKVLIKKLNLSKTLTRVWPKCSRSVTNIQSSETFTMTSLFSLGGGEAPKQWFTFPASLSITAQTDQGSICSLILFYNTGLTLTLC